MQSVTITTNVVELESRSGEVYSIQHYVIKFVWLATGMWFSMGTSVSSTNKTDCHDIAEILLNTITLTLIPLKNKEWENH